MQKIRDHVVAHDCPVPPEQTCVCTAAQQDKMQKMPRTPKMGPEFVYLI